MPRSHMRSVSTSEVPFQTRSRFLGPLGINELRKPNTHDILLVLYLAGEVGSEHIDNILSSARPYSCSRELYSVFAPARSLRRCPVRHPLVKLHGPALPVINGSYLTRATRDRRQQRRALNFSLEVILYTRPMIGLNVIRTGKPSVLRDDLTVIQQDENMIGRLTVERILVLDEGWRPSCCRLVDEHCMSDSTIF